MMIQHNLSNLPLLFSEEGPSHHIRELFDHRIIISNNQTKPFQKTYRIAILAPAPTGVVREIERGIVQTLALESILHCNFVTYFSESCQQRAEELVKKIIADGYDAIISLGVVCTMAAKEITSKIAPEFPVIFGAVSNPFEANLVGSKTYSENNLTGAAAEERSRYEDELEIFLKLQPRIENIIIPYNRYQNISHHRITGLEKISQLHNVHLKMIKIEQEKTVMKKIETSVQDGHNNCILLLRDSMILSQVKNIADLCNQKRVILFASDSFFAKC